jgi:hypothetical protein
MPAATLKRPKAVPDTQKKGAVMAELGNRRQASVLTFGPFGRLLCTALLLAVLAWFLLYAGLYGVVGAVVWIGGIMPRALRDIWRRAALPATDLTRLRDATARELALRDRPLKTHAAFDADAPPPRRW